MPYDSFSPNFAVLGDLPAAYQQGQVNRARRSLSELSPTDYGGMAQRLLGAGDLEGAMSLARFGDLNSQRMYEREKDTRDFGLRREQFDLQKRQADEAARGYDYKEVEVNGNKVIVRIDRASGKITQPPIEGQPTAPGNPFLGEAGSNFKTAEQSKDAGFADRMLHSEALLGGMAVRPGEQGPASPGVQEQGTSRLQRGLEGASASRFNMGGTNFTSNEYQKYQQAKENFITAVLRRESGAVINPDEFVREDKKYFPRPGEGPDIVKQKQEARRIAIESMAQSSGPGYRPKSQFNEQGQLYQRGNPGQGYGQGAAQAAQPQQQGGAQPPMPNAKQAPDGKWYVPDPNRAGKFLMVQ